MSFLFFLFFLFQPDPPLSAELDQQIHVYFQNLEDEEISPESLWSLLQIYLESDSYRERFFAIGDSMNAEWINRLDRDSADPVSFHEVAIHFEDEYLHLYLQLQVYAPEDRLDHFDEFYSSVQKDDLEELNHSIARDSAVSPEPADYKGWDFSTFLLLFYHDSIDLDESLFYERVSTNLRKIIEEGDLHVNPAKNDFLFASLFESLFNTNRYSAVVPFFDYLIDLDYLPNTSAKRNLFWMLDFTLYRAGYLDLSLEVQRKHTIPLSILMDDRTGLNTILAAHGGYLYSIGRYAEAKEVFETALSDRSHLTTSIESRLLNNLSLVYYKLGQNDLYLETQMNALQLASGENDPSHQLNIYRNLHIYYRKNRNWDLALSYIEEARRLAEITDNRSELASIIISKSVYYEKFLDDDETARELLADAELLLDNGTDYRLQVRILYEQATLHKKVGRYEQSREIFEEVLAIGSENNNNQLYLEALVDLADIELALENTEKAGGYIREFNVHDVNDADFFVLVNARRIEAEIAYRERRFTDGERLISRVYSQVLERARGTTDVEAGYWHVEEAYLKLFKLYADLLMEQERFGDMLNVLDQFKTINDASLIDNPLIQADLLTEEELTENRRITKELDQLRKKLLSSDQADRLALHNEISGLNARKNQLTRQQSSSDLFRNLSLWAIQSRIGSDEIILHATRILDHLYLFMIDKKNITQKKLSFGEQEELMFEKAINGLTRGETNLEDLHDVFSYLELETLPRHVNSLIVLPDSYLYQLPVDVLPVSPPPTPTSYGAADYLIEQMEVRYLNNLQDVIRSESRRQYERDFTGIGISTFTDTHGPGLISLPKAPHEVTSIAGSLDRLGEKVSLLESEATPAAFRNNASSSRILHLASHSKISETDPLFSTIYLNPDSNSPVDNHAGQLFAYQIFDMNLRNDLIMLNSCESGSGEFFQGAGIMGISRALRYAGARSLVLNSWSVNDQFASDFAISFYEQLNRGETKSYSLREAKMDFLKNKNADPHYWGAYMLNGGTQPVVEKPGRNASLALLTVFFTGAVFFTRFRLSRHAGTVG
ncbi:MAG: CHAT domain-containing protein [Balneolaceae bacterium]